MRVLVPLLLLAALSSLATAARGQIDDRSLLEPRPELRAGLEAWIASDHLSLDRLAPTVRELTPALHRMPALSFAWYRPAVAPGERPMLALRQDVYLDDAGGLRAALEMPTDVFEYLAHALLLAWFHLESSAASAGTAGGYLELAEERSEALMGELEPETRQAQYVTAVASFGSHLLALRNEIERARSRRGPADDGLCRALRAEVGLFAGWRRALGDEVFRGYADERTAVPLEAVDKRAFVEQFLGRSWTGDPAHDLTAELCSD